MGAAVPACYPGGGGGTNPPTTTFYFPVGLAVSSGGNALYASNSDFDLQWNGGTLQSYDLFLIRRHTGELIQANAGNPWLATGSETTPDPEISFLTPWQSSCQSATTVSNPDGTRIPLGQVCAPPVDSTKYWRDSAIIGAFATDLQLQTVEATSPVCPSPPCVGTRLFTPVRGDASLTWADVGTDDPTKPPPEPCPISCATADACAHCPSPPSTPPMSPAFALDCGQNANGGVCDATHHAGNNPNEPGDSRLLTMPGEPFGMAQTEDATAISITHQTETETSLLLAASPGRPEGDPSMQFVLSGVANGGSGITAVPHDKDASVRPCELFDYEAGCVRPAFLETSHATAELDLLRYYDDDGSSLHRPYLNKERPYTFTTNFGGTDSRGIAIDPTPRLTCKAKATAKPDDIQACAELPARVFFANRTPPSLVIGEIGGTTTTGDTYDPDLLTLDTNIPLPAGPSRVYVAPIVNLQHKLEVRVFVVNFDSSTISVYDPNGGTSNLALVDTIYVGPGPFAMAFDPFSLNDVATNATDGLDPRQPSSLNLRTYRFAYVASFTQSYVQVIDLDQSQPTYESVVFTLGKPTPPKGT